MDAVIERAKLSVDDAFLYEGRRRGYISVEALAALSNEQSFIVDDDGRKGALVARLAELDAKKESLRTNRTLELASFEHIPFKTCNGSVYLHTLQVLRSAGFSPLYLEHNPSKAYFLVCRVLSGLGLNLGSCFLKQGKSKYVYISLHAALYLFDTEFGPFKDKEKTAAIRDAIR